MHVTLFVTSLQLATIVDQDRRKATAVIQLNLSKDVMDVDFDYICEYIGDLEEDMDTL